MLQRLFLFLVLSLIASSLYCQQPIFFDYDDAGNRIKRYEDVFVLKSLMPSDEDGQDLSQCDSIISKNDMQLSTEIPLMQSIDDYEFEIYPNPTRGMLMIRMISSGNHLNLTLRIIDISGKSILMLPFLQEMNYIDLTKQVSGSYILIIESAQSKKEWLIIKE